MLLHNVCTTDTQTHHTCTCRFKRKNVILAGLWFHKEKPVMSTFLRQLVQEFNILHDKGIN